MRIDRTKICDEDRNCHKMKVARALRRGIVISVKSIAVDINRRRLKNAQVTSLVTKDIVIRKIFTVT